MCRLAVKRQVLYFVHKKKLTTAVSPSVELRTNDFCLNQKFYYSLLVSLFGHSEVSDLDDVVARQQDVAASEVAV